MATTPVTSQPPTEPTAAVIEELTVVSDEMATNDAGVNSY